MTHRGGGRREKLMVFHRGLEIKCLKGINAPDEQDRTTPLVCYSYITQLLRLEGTSGGMGGTGGNPVW